MSKVKAICVSLLVAPATSSVVYPNNHRHADTLNTIHSERAKSESLRGNTKPRSTEELNLDLNNIFEHQNTLRVVGGSNTATSRYPYFAMLIGSSSLCGGSLIAPDMILTAAHCPVIESAFVGMENTQARIDDNESFNIQEEFTHPSYNGETHRYDQKLLKLKGTSAAPILHVPSDFLEVDLVGKDLRLLGFGALSSGTYPSKLQEAEQTIVPLKDCLQLGDEDVNFGDLLYSDMICATGNNSGACFGDSGGPLIALGDSMDEDSVVGVVSWGTSPCAKWPSVFSSAAASYTWIKETVCMFSSQPPSHFNCDSPAPSAPSPLQVPAPSGNSDQQIPFPPEPTATPTGSLPPSYKPTILPSNSPSLFPTPLPSVAAAAQSLGKDTFQAVGSHSNNDLFDPEEDMTQNFSSHPARTTILSNMLQFLVITATIIMSF